MIEIKFIYKRNSLSILPKDNKHYALSLLGNISWTSSDAQAYIDYTQKIKDGEYEDDIEIEVGQWSSGYILVYQKLKEAYVFENGVDNAPILLTLTLDEVIDFLTQLRDFLISVGK